MWGQRFLDPAGYEARLHEEADRRVRTHERVNEQLRDQLREEELLRAEELERRIEKTPVLMNGLEVGYAVFDERGPETSAGRHLRHVQAIEAVLRRSAFVMAADGPGGAPSDYELRELAEELLAAAETGI